MSAPAFVPMSGALFVDRVPGITYRPDDEAAHRAGWDSVPRTHRGCPDVSCTVCLAEIRAASAASVALTRPLGTFEAIDYGKGARFHVTDAGRAAAMTFECGNVCRVVEPYGFVAEAGCLVHDGGLTS